MNTSQDRKDSHLSVCLTEAVEFYSPHANGFAALRFDHDALPEIDYDAIQLDTQLFGKHLRAPLVVGAMTGGTEWAGEINRRLALAADACGVGFSLGSQRKMLENQEVDNTFQVKKFAPNLPLLIGNLGAVQLNYGADSRKIRDIIERTQCDAFNFHLNPLQEAIQAEGDRNFSNLIPKLKECIADLPVPILIKEVGAGISRTTAKKLKGLQIAGIETAGTGGTSWAKIEGLRRKDESGQNLGDLFARWGIPTVESLIICREEFPNLTIVASGGVRNGIEVAKAIALGADAVAMALPFLKEAEKSVEHAISAIQSVILELRTTLFVTGMSDLKELKVKGRSLLRRERDATG